MCLAAPGEVVKWLEREPPFARAVIQFGGVRREVSMAFTPDAEVGDYVIVHAGVAIRRIDPKDAAQVLETLDQLIRPEQAERDAALRGGEPAEGGAGS